MKLYGPPLLENQTTIKRTFGPWQQQQQQRHHLYHHTTTNNNNNNDGNIKSKDTNNNKHPHATLLWMYTFCRVSAVFGKKSKALTTARMTFPRHKKNAHQIFSTSATYIPRGQICIFAYATHSIAPPHKKRRSRIGLKFLLPMGATGISNYLGSYVKYTQNLTASSSSQKN